MQGVYDDDYLNALVQREEKKLVDTTNEVDLTGGVSASEREAAVRWFDHVCKSYDLRPITFHRSVSVLDLFSTRYNLFDPCRETECERVIELRALAAAVVFIGWKLEECRDGEVYSDVLSDESCNLHVGGRIVRLRQVTSEEIAAMEALVLTVLHFDVRVPTSYEFLCVSIPEGSRLKFLDEVVREYSTFTGSTRRLLPSVVAKQTLRVHHAFRRGQAIPDADPFSHRILCIMTKLRSSAKKRRRHGRKNAATRP